MPDDGNEQIKLELPKETHIANDRVFLLHRNKLLNKLLTQCLKSGFVNDEIKEMKGVGNQARF